MLRKRWSTLQRFSIVFSLTVLLVCLPLIIAKAPRLPKKIAQLKQGVEHFINWELNPGSIVTITNQSEAQPLLPLHADAIVSPLKINPANPRYFTDQSGKAILLTGSHTWQNFQDSGNSNPPAPFDYPTYLDFLTQNHHNFFRLWTWEQPRWSLDSPDDNFWFSPMPFQRVGPELAADGLPKFDLAQFNQAYFDRLRERVATAGQRGIYVSVMLFNGWSVASDKGILGGQNPWQSHPLNHVNNINSVDGDPNGDQSGEETHQLALPEVTALQEAYVRKVIETINDLDNVLYEISNESDVSSIQWQYHWINFIKNYESSKPKQHPVGMTAAYPNGNNIDLLASPADWISPNGDINNRPTAVGQKVIVADTDHLCGVCGDQQWVWESFTQGENPIFMDVYDGKFDLIVEKVPDNPLNYDLWANLRRSLGFALTYANRINLVAMEPRSDLASSGYCLANLDNSSAEYLIYMPSGSKATVDLSGVEGTMTGEWFNPSTGLITGGIKASAGSRRLFPVPFEGDAILYLKNSQKR